MSLSPFRALLTWRLGRSHWVFQRTDDAMSTIVLVVGIPLQLGLPFLVGGAIGWCWLLSLPLCLLSGRVLRFRDGSARSWRVFVGLPMPGGQRLVGPLRVELGEREIDFATFIPAVSVLDEHGAAVELAVQPGQERPLHRALDQALTRSAAPCCF